MDTKTGVALTRALVSPFLSSLTQREEEWRGRGGECLGPVTSGGSGGRLRHGNLSTRTFFKLRGEVDQL